LGRPATWQSRRGGLRVIYYFFPGEQQIWLMTLYDKNEASDVTPKEKQALKGAIETELRARHIPKRAGLKLKVAGLWNGQVSKALEHLCELKWLLAQGDHVEKEIDIFRTTRFFDGELHRLSSGDDKVLGSRPESVEKFEKVGALGFRNHMAFQRRAIAFSRR